MNFIWLHRNGQDLADPDTVGVSRVPSSYPQLCYRSSWISSSNCDNTRAAIVRWSCKFANCKAEHCRETICRVLAPSKCSANSKIPSNCNYCTWTQQEVTAWGTEGAFWVLQHCRGISPYQQSCRCGNLPTSCNFIAHTHLRVGKNDPRVKNPYGNSTVGQPRPFKDQCHLSLPFK